ncbi:nagb/rpia/CoA transferase-like protein [Dothidotthia symphoricarpi CBS 119687]|uniref:Translation initiation factor eIF2B subunit delta n=1 Tax=Dothidotthia symphoricarpi CBS 119687 TaxID=1392245 RepID=A0A6A6A3G8_9PLEO|nr:nagb/rpia/CoA transferase-like protein [Dothidotthia symphoricarpi CBS 119687]KAF2126350.1 nagb/rpia/CoA transferase-like protein [Dothidotthia symphoricarpi CBS 119687]
MSETPAPESVATPPVASEQTQNNPPATTNGDATNATKKISPAELKKQKQAEKQARRAQAKGPGGAEDQQQASTKDGQKQQKDSKQAPKDDKSRPMPARRKPSQSNVPATKEAKKEPSKEPKKVGLFFGHLYSQPKQQSMKGASKDVHPAVSALGLQYSSYAICGSTARMVAMLLAFKAVIASYQTPPGTSLARHLTNHHLSPQIEYLKSCRPLSISMGNAIRWLKDIIIKIDPSTPENEAKRDLLEEIDIFIRERVTAADKLICELATKKIEPGDVVLTYAASSIVEQAILHAHKAGINFSVIVVDSKPLFEGKTLARKLANQGISVQYYLITGASHAVKDATKVFLGAHAMMSNGRLYSRVGTAVVSMLASAHSLPVIVLCQSVKFTEKVALDSIVGNEVAPAEEILSEAERQELLPLKSLLPSNSAKNDDKTAPEEAKPDTTDVLKWIDDSKNLNFLQVLYDVTPAHYINMVITEYGSLPPSSVPVVHRLSTNT